MFIYRYSLFSSQVSCWHTCRWTFWSS